jgi:hypothetical protein
MKSHRHGLVLEVAAGMAFIVGERPPGASPMPPLQLNDHEMRFYAAWPSRSSSSAGRNFCRKWRPSSRRDDRRARSARAQCTGWRGRFSGSSSTRPNSPTRQGARGPDLCGTPAKGATAAELLATVAPQGPLSTGAKTQQGLVLVGSHRARKSVSGRRQPAQLEAGGDLRLGCLGGTARACRLWLAAGPSGAGLALGPSPVQASPAPSGADPGAGREETGRLRWRAGRPLLPRRARCR